MLHTGTAGGTAVLNSSQPGNNSGVEQFSTREQQRDSTDGHQRRDSTEGTTAVLHPGNNSGDTQGVQRWDTQGVQRWDTQVV